nr:hypothetical protein [uncultured Albidiferax sp.]
MRKIGFMGVALGCIALLLPGCAAVDRTALTSLEPLHSDETAKYFKFKAVADVGAYKLDSPDAEKIRMEWLEKWLQDNGMAGRKYEVVSRTPVIKEKWPWGNLYDVFYEIKVPR